MLVLNYLLPISILIHQSLSIKYLSKNFDPEQQQIIFYQRTSNKRLKELLLAKSQDIINQIDKSIGILSNRIELIK